MLDQAVRKPMNFTYHYEKKEIPYVGEKNITSFENEDLDHQHGIYTITGVGAPTLGFWNGSCLYLGMNELWRVKIKEKSAKEE